MKVLCLFLFIIVMEGCKGVSGPSGNGSKKFKLVEIDHNQKSVVDKEIKRVFEERELKGVVRTIFKAQGTVKKYAPHLIQLGNKLIGIVTFFLNSLLLFILNNMIFIKSAVVVGSLMIITRLFSGYGHNSISGTMIEPQSSSQLLYSSGAPYNYAKPSFAQDVNDLAYNAQQPS